MSLHDDAREPQAVEHSAYSRRTVLRGAAGAGAAGIAAASLLGAAGPALASTKPQARPEPAAHTEHPAEAVIVHVVNARTGELDVYHGTAHTRVHDRDLAARLVRASR